MAEWLGSMTVDREFLGSNLTPVESFPSAFTSGKLMWNLTEVDIVQKYVTYRTQDCNFFLQRWQCFCLLWLFAFDAVIDVLPEKSSFSWDVGKLKMWENIYLCIYINFLVGGHFGVGTMIGETVKKFFESASSLANPIGSFFLWNLHKNPCLSEILTRHLSIPWLRVP